MQAVVFDVGRVLVHWAPQVIEEALSRLCPASPAEIHAAQERVRHELSIGTLAATDFHRYLVETIGMDPVWDHFFEAYCRGLCRDQTALSYAVELKRRGVTVGVISNTNHVHALWLRTHVPEFATFDSIVLSSDVGRTKPDPAIYARSLHELQVDPKRALFVDDLAENVAGARNAGMDALLHQNWDASMPSIETWLELGE